MPVPLLNHPTAQSPRGGTPVEVRNEMAGIAIDCLGVACLSGESLRAAGDHRIAAARSAEGQALHADARGQESRRGREDSLDDAGLFHAGDSRSARDDQGGSTAAEGRYATSWSSRPRTLPLACTRFGSSRATAFRMFSCSRSARFRNSPRTNRAPARCPTPTTVGDAQPLPSPPFTLNGTLRGPERDVFRMSAKAGEKRVIEMEARRCGSAIDPLIEILDASGKVLARSEDAPLVGLDARVEVVFPRDGFYDVVVRDARFSAQTANFYRLKIGTYSYPREVFPLGGRRGELVETSLGLEKIKVDLRNAASNVRQIFVNVPGSPALPLPFAVGDVPEVNAPVDAPVSSPVTINARLLKAGQVDRYTVRVPPSRAMTFRIQARELGTSKLMAVISARDENGNVLGRSGDEPLAEDLYNVNQSRTAGDPILRLQAPADVNHVTVTVEDLALRGGPDYAYRLNVRRWRKTFGWL